MESNILLSEKIKNEGLTITSEHPYSEDNFERKFQAKLSLSNFFLTTKRIIDRVQGKTTHGIKNVLIKKIKNEVLTFTYEHPYYAGHFEGKFHSKISPSDQSFEQSEE